MRLNKPTSPRLTPYTLCSSPQPSWWLLLDSVQNVNILRAPGSPKTGCSTPDMVSQVPNRGEDHFPGPAGYAFANTAQDAVGLLCCKDTLPTHVQLVVQQDTRDLFCRAASCTVSPETVRLHGMIPSQAQDFALAFADLHEVPLSPFLQSVHIPLKSSPALHCSDSSTQSDVVHKHADSALHPVIVDLPFINTHSQSPSCRSCV